MVAMLHEPSESRQTNRARRPDGPLPAKLPAADIMFYVEQSAVRSADLI